MTSPAGPGAAGDWGAARQDAAPDLYELISTAAGRFGDRPFLLPVEAALEPVGFAGLLGSVHACDEHFGDLGAQPGDRVAMVLPNGTPAALLFLGLIASSRVLVPLNPKSGAGELAFILGQTAPKVVVCEPARVEELRGLYPQARVVAADDALLHRLLAGAAATRPLSGDPERDAEIVYTSGSTGRPKGVVLSHRSMLADAFALGSWFGVTEQDTFLTVCPLFHNSGQIFTVLTPLLAGGRTTVVRSEVAMLRFWSFVDRFRPTLTLVVNAYLGMMLTRPQRPAWTGLRGILSGGSRLSQELIDRFESTFDTAVLQCYGLTETTSVATCEPLGADGQAVRSGAGRPLPGCDVIVAAEGAGGERPEAAAPGVRGEVLIRGRNLFSRYLDLPELTAEKLRNGWLHTGDVGVVDEQGNLNIVDRLDNMVIVGGENVYPAEIETVARELPGFGESVVVTLPEEILGVELVLVHTPPPGAPAEPAGWREAFGAELSRFKVPRRVVALADLGLAEYPRAANGKILRARVQELVTDRLSVRAVPTVPARQEAAR